jgi:hypothetical protein
MTKRTVTSALAALLLAVSLAACSSTDSDNSEPQTRVVECDVDDQAEHDSDCGYYDDSNTWIWYPFVVQGQSTQGVANHPAHDEDESSASHSKPKKSSSKKAKDTKKTPKVKAPTTARKK